MLEAMVPVCGPVSTGSSSRTDPASCGDAAALQKYANVLAAWMLDRRWRRRQDTGGRREWRSWTNFGTGGCSRGSGDSRVKASRDGR